MFHWSLMPVTRAIFIELYHINWIYTYKLKKLNKECIVPLLPNNIHFPFIYLSVISYSQFHTFLTPPLCSNFPAVCLFIFPFFLSSYFPSEINLITLSPCNQADDSALLQKRNKKLYLNKKGKWQPFLLERKAFNPVNHGTP